MNLLSIRGPRRRDTQKLLRIPCWASTLACRATLPECSRCTSPTRRPTTFRNSASENASSDAASGNDMPAVNHAYALSATILPGNLPRLLPKEFSYNNAPYDSNIRSKYLHCKRGLHHRDRVLKIASDFDFLLSCVFERAINILCNVCKPHAVGVRRESKIKRHPKASP